METFTRKKTLKNRINTVFNNIVAANSRTVSIKSLIILLGTMFINPKGKLSKTNSSPARGMLMLPYGGDGLSECREELKVIQPEGKTI